jgi:hypothetical protein
MESKMQLRKPVYGQEFEDLCKMLWGEIWNCPEIKKNGRTGQGQNGVDIYGKPEKESGYYGIQCKGKDEYARAKLSKAEIIQEIESAKEFKPALRKLYIATSGNKDVKIEEFVRGLNLASIAAGLFEIHLYCWEDIVDLIDRNKGTHDWYINNNKFKNQNSISFTFENGKAEMTAKVEFLKKIKSYQTKEDPKIELPDYLKAIDNFNGKCSLLSKSFYPQVRLKQNKSYCVLKFCLENRGLNTLTNSKVNLKFIGDFQDIIDRDINDFPDIAGIGAKNIWIDDDDKKAAVIQTRKGILVPSDGLITYPISIKPLNKDNSQISIEWNFLSSEYQEKGVLELNFEPSYRRKKSVIIVNTKHEERKDESIEDYIV